MDGGGVSAAVVGVDDLVAVAPQHQGGQLEVREPSGQGGVAHRCPGVGGQGGAVAGGDGLRGWRQRGGVDAERLGVVEAEREDLVHGEGEEVRDRVAGDFDAHRVDEDGAADPRRGEQGHLGGDPSADRVPYNGHVVELELAEQRHVERRQARDVG